MYKNKIKVALTIDFEDYNYNFSRDYIGDYPEFNEEELKKIKSYFETGKNVSDEVINLNKVKTKTSSRKILEKVKIKYFPNRLVSKS